MTDGGTITERAPEGDGSDGNTIDEGVPEDGRVAEGPVGAERVVAVATEEYERCALVLLDDLTTRLKSPGAAATLAGQVLLLRWLGLPDADAFREYARVVESLGDAAARSATFDLLAVEAESRGQVPLTEAAFSAALRSLRSKNPRTLRDQNRSPAFFVSAYASVVGASGPLAAWEECIGQASRGVALYAGRNEGGAFLRFGWRARDFSPTAVLSLTLQHAGDLRVPSGSTVKLRAGQSLSLPLLLEGPDDARSVALRGDVRNEADDVLARFEPLDVVLPAAERSLVSVTCIRNRRRSPGAPTSDLGLHCSFEGQPARALNLGDDTGWKDQTLSVLTTGGDEICLRFSAVSPGKDGAGPLERDWVCSRGGLESPPLPIGDDTGWIDQRLQIRAQGRRPICLRHTRVSPITSETIDTGDICSSNGVPSSFVPLGDDTGWKDQMLILRSGAP